MSIKNRVLLHRNGRNQFDINVHTAVLNSNSDAERSEMEKQRESKLCLRFLEQYESKWLTIFIEKSKKDCWGIIYPNNILNGKSLISLNAFYSRSKEFENFSHYLIYILLVEKKVCLNLMGLSDEMAISEMKTYKTRWQIRALMPYIFK